MMNFYLRVFILNLFLTGTAYSQKSSISVHAYDPFGLLKKVGLKIEARYGKLSLLVFGIQRYGIFPKYPGAQMGLEGRFYGKLDSLKAHENFLYCKYFFGNQQYVKSSVIGVLKSPEVPECKYYGLGVGVGRKFFFKNVFVDFNTGLKYTVTDVRQSSAFFVAGPGCYFDLHTNIGYRF